MRSAVSWRVIEGVGIRWFRSSSIIRLAEAICWLGHAWRCRGEVGPRVLSSCSGEMMASWQSASVDRRQ